MILSTPSLWNTICFTADSGDKKFWARITILGDNKNSVVSETKSGRQKNSGGQSDSILGGQVFWAVHIILGSRIILGV